MTIIAAKIAWFIGCVSWFLLRIPFQRKSRRTNVARKVWGKLEVTLLFISTAGLFFVPLIYATTKVFAFADRPFYQWKAYFGIAIFIAALVLFRLTHKQLGRNWSVTLELRENHGLIKDGVYRLVRHPMYSAFWLWAVAQMFLLPNWIAGFAGVIGFGILFFMRVGREEQMMQEGFGAEYTEYMARTKRIIPYIY